MGSRQPTGKFPKTARLLVRKDFQFGSFVRFTSPEFLLIRSHLGKGRVGISLSKKVLRNASARNRVKRLIREAFRLNHTFFLEHDLHVIGREGLSQKWATLSLADVEDRLLSAIK